MHARKSASPVPSSPFAAAPRHQQTIRRIALLAIASCTHPPLCTSPHILVKRSFPTQTSLYTEGSNARGARHPSVTPDLLAAWLDSPDVVPDFDHPVLLVRVAEPGAGVRRRGVRRYTSTALEFAIAPATQRNPTQRSAVKSPKRPAGFETLCAACVALAYVRHHHTVSSLIFETLTFDGHTGRSYLGTALSFFARIIIPPSFGEYVVPTQVQETKAAAGNGQKK